MSGCCGAKEGAAGGVCAAAGLVEMLVEDCGEGEDPEAPVNGEGLPGPLLGLAGEPELGETERPEL